MTLCVEINSQNQEQIVNAIRLIRGVKSVKDTSNIKEVVETKADRKAWKKARKELANGEAMSHEELKRKLGL